MEESSSEDDFSVTQTSQKRRSLAIVEDSESDCEDIPIQKAKERAVGSPETKPQLKKSPAKPIPKPQIEKDGSLSVEKVIGRRLIPGQLLPEYLIQVSGESQNKWISAEKMEENVPKVQLARYLSEEKSLHRKKADSGILQLLSSDAATTSIQNDDSKSEVELEVVGEPKTDISTQRQRKERRKQNSPRMKRQKSMDAFLLKHKKRNGAVSSDEDEDSSEEETPPPPKRQSRWLSSQKTSQEIKRQRKSISKMVAGGTKRSDDEAGQDSSMSDFIVNTDEEEEFQPDVDSSSEEETPKKPKRRKTKTPSRGTRSSARKTRSSKKRQSGDASPMSDFIVDDDVVEFREEEQSSEDSDANIVIKRGDDGKLSISQQAPKSKDDSDDDDEEVDSGFNPSFYRMVDLKNDDIENEDRLMFSQTEEDPLDTFTFYLRYLALAATDDNFLNDFWMRRRRKGDSAQMYKAVKKIEDDITVKRESLTGGTWDQEFVNKLHYYPYYRYDTESDDVSYLLRKCGACNRTSKAELQFNVVLHGPKYQDNAKRVWEPHNWLRCLPEKPEDHTHWTRLDAYTLGNRCRNKTYTYHRMLHWKYRLYLQVEQKLEEVNNDIDEFFEDEAWIKECFQKYEAMRKFVDRYMLKNDVPDHVVTQLEALDEAQHTMDRFLPYRPSSSDEDESN